MIMLFECFLVIGMFSDMVVKGKENSNDMNIWKIAAVANEKYMTLDETKTKITGGAFFVTFETIRQKLNFSYSIVTPIYEWFDGVLENGKSGGMTGQVINKEADMAFIPLFVTYNRSLLMDYTKQLKFFPIIFITKAPEKLPNWTSITRPFSFQIWISIFTAVFIFGLILHQVIKRDFLTDKIAIFWTRFKVYWYLFSTFAYQGNDINPIRKFPSRLLIGIWWLSIVVLVSSYSGILMSYLTYPVNEDIPMTFEELVMAVKKGHYSCGTIKGDGVTDFLLGSKSGHAKFFGDYFRSTNNFYLESEVIANVLNKRFAFIYIDYLINKLIDNQDPNKFVISKDSLETFYSAYPLRKGFPHKDKMSKIITRFFEAGIIDKNYGNPIPASISTSEFRALTLDDLFSPFLLLIAGYVVSSICLIFELFLENSKKCLQY